MSSFDNKQYIETWEYLGSTYRATYSKFAGLVELEELVRVNWLTELFNGGHSRVWKRIYFGHTKPLEKCLDVYKAGKEFCNEKK